MVDLIGNVQQMLTEFTNIALGDPLSALLLAIGSLIFAYSFLGIAYLSAGAVVDLVTPDASREPPLKAR